jgi:hypothetical protein
VQPRSSFAQTYQGTWSTIVDPSDDIYRRFLLLLWVVVSILVNGIALTLLDQTARPGLVGYGAAAAVAAHALTGTGHRRGSQRTVGIRCNATRANSRKWGLFALSVLQELFWDSQIDGCASFWGCFSS